MTDTKASTRVMLRTIILLAWPAMVEQALQTIVQYIDFAMVGAISVEATAAVGLTTTVTWLTNAPLWAMGIGVLACISRALGAKDAQTARSAAMQAIWLSLIVGGALTVITQVCAPFLPGWLKAQDNIRRTGALYFSIICAPMVFRALSYILASALRASGDTRTPMVVNLIMNLINIVLNFLLIYPSRTVSLFGLSFEMPGFGLEVAGAAIATAIAFTFSGVAMLLVLLRSKRISPLGLRAHWDHLVMRRCVQVGFPVALQNIGVFLGQVVFSAQVTALGTIPLAAHSIALTAEQAFYIPGYGMQASASTLAGNALGARDRRQFEHVSRVVLAISVGLMSLTGAFLFGFPAQMMRLFTKDATVIGMGASILRIVACSEPLYAAMIIFEGLFQGVGETRYPFTVSLLTMWGVRILGTLLCINGFGFGLRAVWLCMVGDNVTRALLLGIRFRQDGWKRRLFQAPDDTYGG